MLSRPPAVCSSVRPFATAPGHEPAAILDVATPRLAAPRGHTPARRDPVARRGQFRATTTRHLENAADAAVLTRRCARKQRAAKLAEGVSVARVLRRTDVGFIGPVGSAVAHCGVQGSLVDRRVEACLLLVHGGRTAAGNEQGAREQRRDRAGAYGEGGARTHRATWYGGKEELRRRAGRLAPGVSATPRRLAGNTHRRPI
jgi:hypothetical protein